MMPPVNKNPSRGELRTFGYVMLFGFWLIGALLFFGPWLKTRDVLALGWTASSLQITAVALQGLGVILCVLGLTAPSLAKPVYVVWMTAAMAMGLVMTTILLTVLFVVLLPVFSLVVRLGDPMRKRLNGTDTYWEDFQPHEATLERMRRLF